MPAVSLLKRADFARIPYVRPTLPEQKSPEWSCPSCRVNGNHACRLACRCGHRPGKDHEEKAWVAHRKALAVPLPKGGRKAGVANAPPWAKGRKGDGEKSAPGMLGQVNKLRADLARALKEVKEVKKQAAGSVTIERLRELVDAGGDICGAYLLKEVEVVEEKPPAERRPPKHSIEAEWCTKKAQTKLEKAEAQKADLDTQIAAFEAQRAEVVVKIAEAKVELETAKQEQRETHVAELKKADDIICVVPEGLEEHAAFLDAKKLFEENLRAIRVEVVAAKKLAAEEAEKAKADEEMVDAVALDGVVVSQRFEGNGLVGPARPANAQHTFSIEELVEAGFLKPDDAKRSAEACMQQREAT